jgi:hypothetical protein
MYIYHCRLSLHEPLFSPLVRSGGYMKQVAISIIMR